MKSKILDRIYISVKMIYSKPRYIALNLFALAAYYLLLTTIMRYQDYGVLLILIPTYLFYLLIITGSILLTISIYSIKNTTMNNARFFGGSTSTLTALFGGIVVGCGCSAPILLGLTAVGLNVSTVLALNNFFSNTTLPIFTLMIAINLVAMIYYLNKLANPTCRLDLKNNQPNRNKP